MLTTLRIKNLALVEELTLEPDDGYNVISGETGAGKSILIGALNLVLGERAERTLIRSGAESCSVEAVFELGRLKGRVAAFLEENGLDPCEDNQLLLKRSFTAAGANKQFINGSPTTLNNLAAIGEFLVDIHGPHEHQSLLHANRQLAILDAFGDLEAEREAFGALLHKLTTVETEKAALIVDEKTYAQQVDLLRFQTNEISGARLQPGEDEQVEQEYRRASNAAKLLQLSQEALAVLSEGDGSVLTQAGVLGRSLLELQRVDSSTAPTLETHAQVVALLADLQHQLSNYSERVELDPARLQQLEERLNLLQSLKRKYGSGLAEVLAFGEEARRKLMSLEQRETELARLDNEAKNIRAELWRSGQALSTRRRKLIPELSKAVSKQLADLGFRQSRFEIELKTVKPGPDAPAFSASGLDTTEFQFAPNPGEPARPLRAIASSGELARVMLALKTVLAEQDEVPVLVFDEVDANVGGETARAVGEKMQHIARKRQVLCITHLPQVAAAAEVHFVATKQLKDGRTITEISLLDSKQRVTELAGMLGGQSEIARKHAEALIEG